MDFKWDKSIFGEKVQDVEKVIEQSISYATKNKAIELEEKFNNEKSEYEIKLKEYQEKILNLELNSIDDTNKKVIKALIKDNDLNIVKEQYPHLFKQNIINAEDVLNNKGFTFIDEEIKVLEKEKANLPLTEEEKIIWSKAIIKSQK